jgi:hypothetical protein
MVTGYAKTMIMVTGYANSGRGVCGEAGMTEEPR